MKRIIPTALAIIALLMPITAKAETKTATFDFSVNTYGFPSCPGISETGSSSYIISPETAISNNGVTITLAPSPYKAGSKYIANWRSDINALYYNNLSHFIIKTSETGASITNVTITFSNGKNGSRSYFYDTWQSSRVDLSSYYTLKDDIGTLDLSTQKYSVIQWFNNQAQAELYIKKIEVSYNMITSGIENATDSSFKVIAGKGNIRIDGNANNIQIYNIGGAMISQNRCSIECQPGIYIVKVNGIAKKVIVK